MAAASNLALKINDLDSEWGPGEGPGQALREAYAKPQEPNLHIIEQVIGQDEGLDLPSSTDPRILVPGKHDAAFQLRSMDPRAHGDVRQLLDALDGREIVLLIRTQDSPTEMLKSLWTQMREQLPHDENYHYPFLMKEFASQVHGFAGRTGAGTVQLRLSSHGTPIESLSPEKSATFYQATAYDGDSRRDSALRKASLELTLGAAGTGSVDPQKLAQEVQPEDGRPFLLLCLGADQTTDTMPMSDQMKLNKALVEREAYDTVYTSSISAEVTPESLKAQEIENRVATIEMLSEWARHPEADPKVKSELVKQLGAAIKEISKPATLAKLPVGVALAATEALKDIAENHPVMADPEFVAPGKAIEMAITAQKVQRVVVELAPEGALETLHITPANENTPLAPDQEIMATAIIEARIEQVKTLFEKLDAPIAAEQSAQLIDERTLKAVEAQPVIPEGVKAKVAEVQKQVEPLRRRSELKSEAPQLDELKAIDPKGALKIEPKAQKVLQALQEQLKANPKLREELAKNKEIAPLVEALDKTDFTKPSDVAKLAAQVAKLPSAARAEIAEKVAPVMPEAARESFKQEFAEVAQQITQAVAMEAIVPQIAAPIEALKEILETAPVEPEQKEKLEALSQQLAEAKDPEAIREIIKQLNEVIAELPKEITAEIPQLKEFTEVTRKWESEPAAFEQFVAESTVAYADTQIAVIEQVEAVHLATDVGAKIELTLDALKELPLGGPQQEQVQQLMQQMEGADPAELKEIISKLDDLIKVLPPEAAKELPPAIKEIQEGLKSADLSSLKQAEIAPEVKAEIGAKLGLTLDALKDAPLKPAEQKQIQEIAKQLTSDNPAEVRRAAQQLDKMVAKLPPEAVKQLPPALKELRETLKAVEQPRVAAAAQVITSKFQPALAAEFKPAPRPVEFSIPVVESLKKFQAAVKSSPAAAGLPFSVRQIEALVKADLSKPAVQQQIAAIISAAPTIKENKTTQPSVQKQQVSAQQQLQQILKLPEVQAQRIIQQVKNLQSANATPAEVRIAIEQYGVTINQTMSSGSLHRIANDPNAPPALRMQAFMWYLEQLQREKKQQMEQMLAAQAQPQIAQQNQARQIADDLGNASSQMRDTRQDMQMQAAQSMIPVAAVINSYGSDSKIDAVNQPVSYMATANDNGLINISPAIVSQIMQLSGQENISQGYSTSNYYESQQGMPSQYGSVDFGVPLNSATTSLIQDYKAPDSPSASQNLGGPCGTGPCGGCALQNSCSKQREYTQAEVDRISEESRLVSLDHIELGPFQEGYIEAANEGRNRIGEASYSDTTNLIGSNTADKLYTGPTLDDGLILPEDTRLAKSDPDICPITGKVGDKRNCPGKLPEEGVIDGNPLDARKAEEQAKTGDLSQEVNRRARNSQPKVNLNAGPPPF